MPNSNNVNNITEYRHVSTEKAKLWKKHYSLQVNNVASTKGQRSRERIYGTLNPNTSIYWQRETSGVELFESGSLFLPYRISSVCADRNDSRKSLISCWISSLAVFTFCTVRRHVCITENCLLNVYLTICSSTLSNINPSDVIAWLCIFDNPCLGARVVH